MVTLTGLARHAIGVAATVPFVNIALAIPSAGLVVGHVSPAAAMSAAAWTAVGTIALAVLTFAAVATTIVVTVQDRRRTDAQLARQLEHSETQMREERARVQEGEQQASAWAVEIVPGTDGLDESDTSSMTVLVSNLSTRTIVRIEAKFSPDGINLVRGARAEHLHKRIVDDSRHPYFSVPDGRFGVAYNGILTPGSCMRFWSDEVADKNLKAPYPVVRWTDSLGQRWEHKKGEVRKISESEPWFP